MKILKDTVLFGLFASYADGVRNGEEKLSAAYDDFATLLATLPTDGTNICAQLRRLFYTKIELRGIQETVSTNGMEGTFCSMFTSARHLRCWMRRNR